MNGEKFITTPDQDALIQLDKEADIMWNWEKEVGVSELKNYHAPQYDRYLNREQYHMKINGMHINIYGE